MTFEEWMKIVNERVSHELGGLTTDDLPDMDYWSAWNDGTEPNEMACEVLEENGFDWEALREG